LVKEIRIGKLRVREFSRKTSFWEKREKPREEKSQRRESL